jgi:HKD family nuclease
MVLHVEFHSDTLHKPLLDTIEKYAAGSDSIDIAIGFLSQSGLNKIIEICNKNSSIKNVRIVCGALSGHAVKLSSKQSSSKVIKIKIDFPYINKKNKFTPMMHSKVYLFKTGEKRTSIVGSSNLTHFALAGKNVEANTIAIGDTSNDIFTNQQSHFDKIWDRSQTLNHALAIYYDTLFKQCYQGWAFPEFKGTPFPDTNEIRTVNSFVSITNKGIIPKIGNTIVFLNPPKEYRDLIRTHHLFHIGGDNFIFAECLGGLRSGSGITDKKFHYKVKDISRPELEKCGKISISTATEWTVFRISELVKAHQILSSLKQINPSLRTKAAILELLDLSDEDTISTNPNEFHENFKGSNKNIEFKKIKGFKEPKANKLLALLIRGNEGDAPNKRPVCFFNKSDYYLFDRLSDEFDDVEPEMPKIYFDTFEE